MPGHEKIVSTTTAPAMSAPTMKPTMVTIGTDALGKACFHTTSLQLMPLADAVRI